MLLSLLAAVLAATAGAAPPMGDGAKRSACNKAFENSLDLVLGIGATLAQGLAEKPSETPVARCMQKHNDLKTCLKLDDSAIQRQIASAVEVCLKWPDAYVACVSDVDRMQSPACRKESEAFEGLVPSEPMADGPAPLWQLTLPARADDAMASNGVIIAIGDKEMFAVRGRNVAWRRPIERSDAFFVPESGCMLFVSGDEFGCLDPATGGEKWGGGHPGDDKFTGGAHARGQTVLSDGTGQMFVVDARACAANSPKCVVHSGKVGDGLLRRLAILPSGDRVVLEDAKKMFFTDRAGKQYAAMTLSGDGSFSVGTDGSLLLSYEGTGGDRGGKFLACLDPRRCRSGKSRDPIERCGVVLGKTDASHEFIESDPITLSNGDVIVNAIKLRRWGKLGVEDACRR